VASSSGALEAAAQQAQQAAASVAQALCPDCMLQRDDGTRSRDTLLRVQRLAATELEEAFMVRSSALPGVSLCMSAWSCESRPGLWCALIRYRISRVQAFRPGFTFRSLAVLRREQHGA
jgi:hypothetical protein